MFRQHWMFMNSKRCVKNTTHIFIVLENWETNPNDPN